MVFTGSQKVRLEDDCSILALFLMFPLQVWLLFCWFKWLLDLTQKRKLTGWCLRGLSFMLGLIWNVWSQRCGTLINYGDIIAATVPGQALTCFEAELPALFLLALGVWPLSWVLISLMLSSVLPLGPCWSEFRIHFQATVWLQFRSLLLTLKSLGMYWEGKLMECFCLGSVCFQREAGWVHNANVIQFRSSH